jgi:hypothetical protein
MIFRAFDELISALPAVFSSQLSAPDTAKLLAQGTMHATQSGERVVASVDGSNVVLQRHRRFTRNPLAPIFVGHLRTTSDGTQLVGEFRRRKFVLLLSGLSYFMLLPGIPFALVAIPVMAIWFGVSVSGGVLAGIFFAMALVGVLFAEAVLIRLGVHASRRDASLIAEHIDNVLGRGATEI